LAEFPAMAPLFGQDQMFPAEVASWAGQVEFVPGATPFLAAELGKEQAEVNLKQALRRKYAGVLQLA